MRSAFGEELHSDETSAGTPLRVSGTGPLVLSGALALLMTSVTSATPADAVAQVRSSLQRTNSGIRIGTSDTGDRDASECDDPLPTSAAIMELRRLSGLTWDQLAELFGVDRRSLHFWASGKPLNAGNEERLRRTLSAVRRMDRGGARENRTLLLSEVAGATPFDLLTTGEYDRFAELVGVGKGRSQAKPRPLAREAREEREPQPLEELLGALQDHDYVNKGKGRLLSSTPVRTGRKR